MFPVVCFRFLAYAFRFPLPPKVINKHFRTEKYTLPKVHVLWYRTIGDRLPERIILSEVRTFSLRFWFLLYHQNWNGNVAARRKWLIKITFSDGATSTKRILSKCTIPIVNNKKMFPFKQWLFVVSVLVARRATFNRWERLKGKLKESCNYFSGETFNFSRKTFNFSKNWRESWQEKLAGKLKVFSTILSVNFLPESWRKSWMESWRNFNFIFAENRQLFRC